MPSEDRCEHGMIRDYCAHCQAPPEYEMIKTKFSDTVEILHKGNSINEFDKNFMFGKSKAKLFLACMDIVEEFAATQNNETPDIKSQEVFDTVSGDTISVKLEKLLEFPDKPSIKVPWVHLKSGNNPNVNIGFGRRKAKAIYELRKQLAKWANYPLVDR